jgi:putative OPT family oligopeptide transporter
MSEPSSPSAAPEPYIGADQNVAELSGRAVLLGAMFGVLFGAVTVYLALKVGLTVSASIPIAVLSIVIFRRLGKSTILENNIVQTIGSAGESVASGVVFTLPALIFLGSALSYSRILLIALAGGLLGVLLMIPLRRALIVKEHATLRYPEGTACANILVAGEKGGALAGRVFAGLGVAAVYKLLASVFHFWKEVPAFVARRGLPSMALAVEGSPELLGVGYIIGGRAASTLVAGGLLSSVVLIPMIKFFGAAIPGVIFPGRAPIAQMGADDIWGAYVRYIGAGAVAAGGILNLLRAMPTIVSSFRDSLRAFGGGGATSGARTERDLPITLVFGGSAVLLVGIYALFQFDVNPGHVLANLIAALLIVVYGFFFVTVSARVVGLIGSSNNPISGNTITTLMGTCLLFVLIGWTGHAYAAIALSIGAVVCIAAANAGATSQDLKTGFLVGATPRKQQIGLIVGVVAATLVIGGTLRAMNDAYRRIEPVTPRAGYVVAKDARRDQPTDYRGRRYETVFVEDVEAASGLPDGKYLIDGDGKPLFRYVDGIGGRTLSAPQARLMSLVVDGVLNQKLPWTLVLLGAGIGVTMELCGVEALPFAVGVYLPLSTTTPVFFGGLMKIIADWLVARRRRKQGLKEAANSDDEASEGMLFSSGLIAGGALMGVAAAGLILAAQAWKPLANTLEAIRGDAVEVAGAGNVTVDGKQLALPATLPIRTGRYPVEGKDAHGNVEKHDEVLPGIVVDGNARAFDDVSLAVRDESGNEDATTLDFDLENPRRRVALEQVERWESSLTTPATPANAHVGAWLVRDGADVEYGEELMRIDAEGAPPVSVRAPMRGRVRGFTVRAGDEVHGGVALAVLETEERPPTADAHRADQKRLVVDGVPSSDLFGFLMFMLLCAVTVRGAAPTAPEKASGP